MSEYLCGHCGHKGRGQSNGFSARWCANCQRNDKLELVDTKPDEPDPEVYVYPAPRYTIEQVIDKLLACEDIQIKYRDNEEGCGGFYHADSADEILALLEEK